jgi:putative PIN family toxin of toxin-antitoxin system
MKAVIDTNVLVAAALNPAGTPARVVELARTQKFTAILSPAVMAEYTDVLYRSRFSFPTDVVASLLSDLETLGLWLPDSPMELAGLPDPDDAAFIALARASGASIITGNLRHFPPECGVEVLTPGQALERVIRGAAPRL